MGTIQEMIGELSAVAENPQAELDKHIEAGKRVIGVLTYYAPEELIYAAGAIPFGVWGCIGQATEAKKYFPPFYCSICQMTLEMGLTGKLDKLSGLMTTALCDTLRAFSQNWKAGVPEIPMIYVALPQNRFIEGGRSYAIETYKETKRKVEECAGNMIDDALLTEAISLYNEWRAAMREFLRLAGLHPQEISNADRVAVVNAGYYMDKAEHLEKVRALNEALDKLPASTDGYKKIVLSGIYEDIPAIPAMLDENKYAVVADDLAKESRAFALRVPEEGDPIEALADGWCGLGVDSILYDPEKTHIDKVVQLAQGSGAEGVILLLAKFCDPEEFDAPLVMRESRQHGLNAVTIEVDQSTESYEQARTQLETFGDLF